MRRNISVFQHLQVVIRDDQPEQAAIHRLARVEPGFELDLVQPVEEGIRVDEQRLRGQCGVAAVLEVERKRGEQFGAFGLVTAGKGGRYQGVPRKLAPCR